MRHPLDMHENEWTIIGAVFIVIVIVAITYAIETSHTAKDAGRKTECLDLDGVVLPSSDGWTCALACNVEISND